MKAIYNSPTKQAPTKATIVPIKSISIQRSCRITSPASAATKELNINNTVASPIGRFAAADTHIDINNNTIKIVVNMVVISNH